MTAILELEPSEVSALVQLISMADTERAMVFNENDELTLFENLPEVTTLCLKINALVDLDEVKEYIEKRYGKPDDGEPENDNDLGD